MYLYCLSHMQDVAYLPLDDMVKLDGLTFNKVLLSQVSVHLSLFIFYISPQLNIFNGYFSIYLFLLFSFFFCISYFSALYE